jgi:hypothetical protein
MKKNSLLFIVALLLMVGFAQKSLAQATVQDIDWTAHCQKLSDVLTTDESSPQFVYLYNTAQKKFLTCGGDYGVQGIFANVGMRFYITSSGSGYLIHSRINNAIQGSFMALEHSYYGSNIIYLDRSATSDSRAAWTFNTTDNKNYTLSYSGTYDNWGNTVNYTTYVGYNTTGYIEGVTKRSSKVSNWLLVTEADYKAVISGLHATFINVSGLLYDSRFDRNSADVGAWSFTNGSTTTGSYIHNDVNGNGPIDAYCTARIGEESNTLTQTVSGLSKGLYRITCQGFYSGDGENTCAYLFANTKKSLLQTISSDDQTTLKANAETSNATVENRSIVAGKIFANNNMYNNGENNTVYTNEIYVTVGDNGSISFGVTKDCEAGEVYVDNFQLFYCGTQEMYLSADNATEANIDKTAYPYPVRLNLRRSFTQDAWNAIVLPMNLSGDQVKAAFGNGDAKLSKLVGINPDRPSQIQFTKVDLDKDGITAGECYVVWVTKGPDVKYDANKPYTYTNYNTDTKTIYGPLYQIEGVTQTAYDNSFVTKTYETTSGKLNFTGYYYKPAEKAEVNSYIMGGGNMYYLKDATSIYGTTWKLKDNTPGAKQLSISINGVEEDVVTGIAGLTIDNGAQTATQKVFNLNGQMVKSNSTSLENLPKGIYIVNGKKYVVR